MEKRRRKFKKKRILVAALLGVFVILLLVSIPISKMNPQAKKKTEVPASSKKEYHLNLEEEIGQLIMVGMSANDYNQVSMAAIKKYQLGNVILTGRSNLDIASTRKITDDLQNLAPKNRKLLIATDQEGGYVQVLQGQGFSIIPDGLTQGSWSVEELKKSAQTWGNELKQAGVNFDLAPVADTVTSKEFAPQNAPIGYFGREYAYDSKNIVNHALAFSQGMKVENILTTAKHFPGLGHVTGNTNTTANVTDTETGADSASIDVFKSLINKGIPSIMTATAIYSQIDSKLPGAFSEKVVQGLLRDKLGFDGLVITDDLSDAVQVQAWTAGERAVLAISAGNDIVLANNPEQIPEMVDGLLKKAQSDSTFAKKVHAAANRVLKTKESLNLIQS